MENHTLVFLDTETTGNGPDDRLCQLSYVYHDNQGKHVVNELFRPPLEISFEAMAVHHITRKAVANRPLFREAPEYHTIKTLLESDTTIVIAHNASFDIGMLAHEEIHPQKVIDTLKVLRALDPDVEMGKHSLQYLRYYLDIDSQLPETVMAHDAFGDVLVLELLFERLMTDMISQKSISRTEAIEHMISISQEPMYIGKIMFGKYRGRTLTEIVQSDRGYLEWLLTEKKKNRDAGATDETDWIYSIEKVLHQN